ncbi:hypothetical protein DVH24_007494 [Malus domestica]|uniref:Cytochrome P450 n=1 Tax=Malus domestica TaxID=3750 RepID=A0A498HFI9_MALDO|nr:hypothetical protein DVH24_007494 [Malus domestica]
MLEAANAMRKEVLLLIKEKKAAASRGVQMHDTLSFILFNPDPTGRFMPENEVADKVTGLMAGGFHSPSMATSLLVNTRPFRSSLASGSIGTPKLSEFAREQSHDSAKRKEQSKEGLSESHGWGRVSPRTSSEADSPRESPLISFNLVPARTKHGTTLGRQLEIASSKKSGEALNWEDKQKMKYSWGVALELMRLVYWSASSTNKIPEYFPDPEEFDPTRFENGKTPPAYSNIPFGSGPRICPGKEYARLQLLCSLHHFVTKYKWELV